MADRSSAAIFGEIFSMLADIKEGKQIDVDQMAKHFWEKSKDYDFSTYQMEVDEALKTLGLVEDE